MKLFILPDSAPSSGTVELRGEEYHYLARVRRVRVGQTFAAADGRGRRWHCSVLEIGRASLCLQLSPQLPASGGRGPALTLVQCLPKVPKMDLIIRQAVETGVRRVFPVYSSHSPIKLSPSQEQARLERWRRISRQAQQQSGTELPVQIEGIRPLTDLLTDLGPLSSTEVRLLFHHERVGRHTLHASLSKSAKIVTLVIGPEGGIDSDEVQMLKGAGFIPITVGETVLRTETAALYAIAAVQTIVEERHAWAPL